MGAVLNTRLVFAPRTQDPLGMQRPKPRYQVFVSSTYEDLREEREAVTWALLARHLPVGMETFPATSDRGWEIIQETIDSSDYYVVIVAGRYGSIDEGSDLSWTEKEYRYAQEKGLPVFAFVQETTSELAEPVSKFRAALKRTHNCRHWTDKGDLAMKVLAAVQHEIDHGSERPGWYRGDAMTLMALAAERSPEKREKLVVIFDDGSPVSDLFVQYKFPKIELGDYKGADPITQFSILRGEGDRIVRSTLERMRKRDLTRWVILAVANKGSRPAKLVTVDITPDCEHVEVSSSPSTGVHAQRQEPSDGGVSIRQRVDSVAVGGMEMLVRFGVRPHVPDWDNEHQDLEIPIRYVARSEDGVVTEGHFKITIQVRGTETFMMKDVADDGPRL